MVTMLKLAWRSIWRNKRRTLITIASIAFALFFANIMRGFQTGSYVKMKENAIESYSGYLQIQKKGYWDDKNINNVFSIDQEKLERIYSNSKIKEILPRLESFALASSGEATKGAVIIGVSPSKEDSMTKVSSFLTKGDFINEKESSIVLGEGLAKFLKIEVNDTLVLFSSGYHGATAAGLFKVKGILDLPTPEMNKSTIYMPISHAQEFFDTGNQFTSLAFDIQNLDDVSNLEKFVTSTINSDDYVVMNWEEMNKELLQMIESDNAGGIIMIGILYMVIAFGIFGTVLMMTNERIREFSVMVSVGMQKYRLAIVVFLELLFLTILAVLAGSVISIPVLAYFYFNPIEFSGNALEVMKDFNFEPVMPMNIDPHIFILQALSISILCLIAMSYPIVKIFKLNVVNGLKG